MKGCEGEMTIVGENKLENVIYKINYQNISKLNDIQINLINEIKRFCENNGKFPKEKEMTKKNGYASRTQYYKHFNTKTFTAIYDYITPIKAQKPNEFKCSKCKTLKNFNLENFPESKYNKYGISNVCRICENKCAVKRRYALKGIYFEEFEDISPEEWWEHLYEGRIGYLPDFCLTKENIIKIFRYVFIDKLNYSRVEIININFFSQATMKKYKIYHLYQKYFNKLKFLEMCFPEMDIKAYELPMTYYSEEVMIETIMDWISLNNLTVDDILTHSYITDRNSSVALMAATKFNSSDPQMFTWYFNNQKILHPRTNQQINTSDFKFKANNYWSTKENRIKAVKSYCEENNIKDALLNTDKLKSWVREYYRQTDINRIYEYSRFHANAYESLVEAYPQVRDNKLLFPWEWHQVNINTKESLIEMLREMVLFRENIKTPKEISNFLRYQILIERGYVKFVKHIQRKRFDSFFDWANQSFPEYKNQWTIEDFGGFYANDGTLCDSLEEVKIYEFVKDELNLDIEAIGVLYSSEYTFKLPDNSVDKWYCPDFIISHEGQKYYVEYFGLYTDKVYNNKLLKNYRDKTHRKIEYYNNTGLNFIYLYREDIQNNFTGIKKKFRVFDIKETTERTF